MARAHDLAAEGVRIARPLADYHRVGSAPSVLATMHAFSGQFDDARAARDPVIRLVDGAESRPFIPVLIRAIGSLHLWAAQPDQAIVWFEHEKKGFEADADEYLDPHTLVGLAAARHAVDDTAGAAAACQRALSWRADWPCRD